MAVKPISPLFHINVQQFILNYFNKTYILLCVIKYLYISYN